MSPLSAFLFCFFLPLFSLAEDGSTMGGSGEPATTPTPTDRVNNGFFGFGVVGRLSGGEWLVIVCLVILAVISCSLMAHFMIQCVRERSKHEDQLQAVATVQTNKPAGTEETKSTSTNN